MGDDIFNLGLRGLRALLDDKKISPAELTGEFCRRARSAAGLNAFLRLQSADAAGAEAEAGAKANSPLAGLPLAHKDIFCDAQDITTCASKMLENFKPPYNSAVVENCRNAGMACIGKTNMDEFAMGSSGEHSAFAAARNPWDASRVPGGSSSGSAAAVAARLAPVATGTDTGGSIRQPAAFCGVTGIKPTYGRVSRWGMVAFASGFDQGGAIGKSAEDCALLLAAMAGFDERDSTSAQKPAEDYAAALQTPMAGRVVGVPREFFADGLRAEVGDCVWGAAKQLEKLGAKIREVSLPNMQYAIAAYYVLTCAEASSNLSRYDGVRYGLRVGKDQDLAGMYAQTRAAGFGAEVKRRILIGAYTLSYGYYDAYYRRAMRARKLIADDFARAFGECDMLLGPATPNVAFPLGAMGGGDAVAMYMQDIYTVPVNLAGLPALCFPCGFVDGMPTGAQLIGKAFDESLLLAAAHQCQQQSDFHLQAPPEAGA